MKKSFFLFVAMCFCLSAFAQKPVVVVDHFTSTGCKDSYVVNLRNHVITGLYETGNVNLIDVESESTLQMEANRRSSELSLADETARLGAMKTLGANYVVTGTASKITADKKGNSYYSGNLAFTLKVVNAEDGTLVGVETYQYSDMLAGTASSADGAIYETLAKIQKDMLVFASKYFQTQGYIVELGEMKNGKLHTCYINLGSSSGLKKGQTLKVYEVKKIAGIEGHEEVGKIKVDEIVAEGLSRCTLVAGAEDVLGAFQEGHDLCVEERVKKDHSAAKAGQKAANVGRNVVEVGREAVDVGKKALEIGEGVSRIINAFKK